MANVFGYILMVTMLIMLFSVPKAPKSQNLSSHAPNIIYKKRDIKTPQLSAFIGTDVKIE